MARYYGGWAPYVPVAERRKRAEREVAKLAKKGQTIAPVKIAGKRITSTFWGTAWCDNLESYRDFENRLPRGRTYVRNGSVLDLQIAPCEIRALVSGSEIYRVSISIAALPKARWQAACQDCAGGIDSLVELLQGRFSKAIELRDEHRIANIQQACSGTLDQTRSCHALPARRLKIKLIHV